MTQLIINVGTTPNDGLGDPIRTAYIKCNDNFSELYSRVQTSVPPTLVGSVGDSVGMYASDSSYFYYCFANYDGSSIIWGQVAGAPTGSHIVNGNSNVDIATANGNVSVAVAGINNVLVFANTGAYVTGAVSATGDVTGDYFIGNGSQLTGIATSSYSDSNVVTLLGAFGSNTISTTGSITSGNVTGDYIIGNGSALTSITGANVTGTVANATYAVSSGTATSATTAATVTTAAQPNITSVGTLTVLSSSGNITGGNVLTGGIISATGDITGGNISATTHTGTTVSVTGTVTSASVVGGIITGTSASVSGTVTAASVVGGVMTGTSTSVLGNVTGGNVLTAGVISATATITGGNLATGGTASATGNITGGNILTGGIISSTGNATVGNLITGGLVSATGNINGGGMTINGNGVVTGNLQIQGNLIYNNLTNITTSNLVFGLANTTTGISANGAGFVVGNTAEASFLYNYSAQAWNSNIGISAVGNIAGGNVLTGGLVSATGNVTGGNVLTGGLVSATGNVTGNNILGNLLATTASVTGTVTSASVVGGIITGTSVSVNGNITGENHFGTSTSVTGNISGNYIIGNGSQLTGLPAGYTNANVFSYLASSNVVISTTGNVTADYFLGNGALLSGLSPTQIFNGTSNVSIPAANGNITMSVASTANVVTISTSSISVAGGLSALSDLVLGNTANASATKTRIVNAGNISYIQTGNGTASSTGNIIFAPYQSTAARVRIDTSSGNISATGNVVATNIGNITPTNFNQSPTQVLYGDGLWKTPQGSGMLDITKFDQGAVGGTNLFIAGGRLFAIKGQNYNYTSGLGVANPTVQNGIPNTYEIIFPNETVGTITDAGIYGQSAYALFDNGQLYTWGINTYGQLGLGNTTTIYKPTVSLSLVAQVYTHPSSFSGDTINYTRLIVRLNNDEFYGCGYNGEGQLGLGNTTATISAWTQITGIPTDVLSVWNLGNYYGCTVIQKADGTIWVTGGNLQGNLGIGNTTTQSGFIAAPQWLGGDTSQRIQYISYGGRYYDGSGAFNYFWMAMFLDNGTTSRLCAAGANNWGDLGTGNTTSSTVPVTPLTSTGLTGRITKIRNTANAPGTMYVQMANGDLFSYGYNTYGAVGNGTTTPVLTPYKLLTGTCADIINDQMGWFYNGYFSPSAIVKKTDGTYYCCGYNAYGSVGVNSSLVTITTLQQIALPKGTVIKFVGTNNGSNEAISKFIVTADNTIWAWGYNGQYNINGTSTGNFLTPVNFVPTALLG